MLKQQYCTFLFYLARRRYSREADTTMYTASAESNKLIHNSIIQNYPKQKKFILVWIGSIGSSFSYFCSLNQFWADDSVFFENNYFIENKVASFSGLYGFTFTTLYMYNSEISKVIEFLILARIVSVLFGPTNLILSKTAHSNFSDCSLGIIL